MPSVRHHLLEQNWSCPEFLDETYGKRCCQEPNGRPNSSGKLNIEVATPQSVQSAPTGQPIGFGPPAHPLAIQDEETGVANGSQGAGWKRC